MSVLAVVMCMIALRLQCPADANYCAMRGLAGQRPDIVILEYRMYLVV